MHMSESRLIHSMEYFDKMAVLFSVRMLIPFICATFVAQRVGEYFNEGLYDIHNGLSGVPILPWNPPVGARLMPVSEFMTSPVVCFTERVRMREVWEALRFTCHNAFPVVRYSAVQRSSQYQKRHGLLIGYVLRQVGHILTLRVFCYFFTNIYNEFNENRRWTILNLMITQF